MDIKSTALAAALALAAAACLPLRAAAASAKAPLIPAREWAMIRQVAVNYDLTEEQTWLLAAIRRHENGRPGLEFGIGGPMNSGHAAHRYRDGTKSFYVQAMWAAGTVRNHYRGDIAAFGRRYNPPGAAKWSAGVSSLVSRLKAENSCRLPGKKPAKRRLEFP
ncbi:MAG: hypothetical protein IJI73_03215 [Kiritimatiellae bacterium]|nr:hypothetical protein [Kiritimatiellia bacterium]